MWERFATIKTLRMEALEERIVFLNILMADQKISSTSKLQIMPYLKEYNKEWERRKLETNNNNN